MPYSVRVCSVGHCGQGNHDISSYPKTCPKIALQLKSHKHATLFAGAAYLRRL